MSQSPPIDVALIGLGARAGLAKHVLDGGGRLVAAVDPDPGRAAYAHENFGPDLPVHRDVSSLLAALPELDAAIVASPDDTHHAVTKQLLEAGVAVYVEKPLAITTADADDLLETAHRTGSRLYVGHNMRHMQVVRQMKGIIDDGAIGEVKAIWCRHFVSPGGDFYFKDWHADRTRSTGLLLQKGAHDLDVIHWLAGATSRVVTAMGALAVYGDIEDRRDNSDRRMWDWYAVDTWPPATQRELNPVVDVEDISMLMSQMDNGVLATYQQCHFAPDYWRNYTVIGTEGRLENLGDTEGSAIHVWSRRTDTRSKPDAVHPITGDARGHGDADRRTVAEFLRFVADGSPTDTSPVSARDAVATAYEATQSLRDGSRPRRIPEVPAELVAYFDAHQPREGRDA